MRKFLSLFLCFLLLLGLCACGRQTIPPAEPTPDDVEAPVLPVPNESTDPVLPEPSESTEPVLPVPSESIEPKISVTLYKGDDNGEYVVPVECEIAEQSPQAIVDKLCELGVFSAPVTVNSFTVDNSNVIHLDMGQDFAGLVQSSGTAGEHLMVGSLVNSFLSVFEADGVYITVNGETFESGHAVYDFTLTFFEN